MPTYAAGDQFEVDDPSSPLHGWRGRVLDTEDEGYECMVEQFNGLRCSLVFGLVRERQMASTVYLDSA